LVGAAAQLSVPLWWTPVPLTLQTLAVLLVGASLGWQRAVPSMLLYMVAGSVGVPWFADGSSGFVGASFGYIVGFVVAAAVVGRLAQAGADRKPLGSLATMVIGSAVIYAIGAPWLAVATGTGLGETLVDGVLPFVVTDLIKSVIAAGVLPTAWWLVGRRND
jgi:biotin transport system substrate-specific component